MITPREIRAARAFLGWSRQDLADRTLLSLNSIVRLEQEKISARTSTVSAVRKVFEMAGIQFLSLSEQGEGIRFKQSNVRGGAYLRRRAAK